MCNCFVGYKILNFVKHANLVSFVEKKGSKPMSGSLGYSVGEVCPKLAEESFQKLEAVSEHPILRQKLDTLFFWTLSYACLRNFLPIQE